jgi:small-conductance mechanosensitive channel
MNLSRIRILLRTMSLYLLLIAGMLTSFYLPAFAANDEVPVPEVTVESFPGLQDVVPMASQLSDDLTRITSEISTDVDIIALTNKTEKLEQDWIAVSDQVRSYGEFSDWPGNRLLQAQTQIGQQNQDFGAMLDQVSKPLSAFEEIRVIWSDRKQFWLNWKKSLKETGANVPLASFRQVDKMIVDMLREVETMTSTLVKLQQRISGEREGLLTLREQLDRELINLRRDPFKRNGHPLLHRDFIQQFDGTLRARFHEGLKATFQFQGDFFSRQGWLVGLQAGLALLLLWVFRGLKRVTADRAEEWGFVFKRPIAAALFIAATIPQLFYLAPPPLLLLLMTTLAVISAARLAAALIIDINERRYIYILAAIYIFSGTLSVIGIPLAYHRLYLTLFSVIGIPALLISAHRHAHRKQYMDKFVAAMILGSLVLLAVVIAEFTGYVTFATHLVEASFGTILILLLALMMLRIGEGGIEFIFTIQNVSGKQFIKQLGKHASHRFKNLLRIVIVISALNYILEVWRFNKDAENIWQTVLGIEFSVGAFSLSLQMILLVILVLYLTLFISWFFQAFIESQIFHNKRIDRGVRDAVKKLIHYALILIGFLVAMSMAGIDLKNFTILAGAFGIGIGFGLQDIVNNFVSGLVLLFERPVKVGDTVNVGENWGVIKKIGMRSTVVETLDLSEIIVPNSQMVSEKVTNWTLSSNISRIVIPVGVKYGTDMKQVLTILEKVANEHPDVVDTPPSSAIFTTFGDSSLNFELRAWITDVKIRFKVRSDLGVAIAEKLHTAGIEIPFPQRDLHLRSVEPGIIAAGSKGLVTKKTAQRKNAGPKKNPEKK